MAPPCGNWFTAHFDWRRSFLCNSFTRTPQASREFVGFQLDPMLSAPDADARRQSLPRRLLGRFLSERTITDDADEAARLKILLKENGLYSKHQTLAQRRRLRQLLEMEQSFGPVEQGATINHPPVGWMIYDGVDWSGEYPTDGGNRLFSRISSETRLLYHHKLMHGFPKPHQSFLSLPVLPLKRNMHDTVGVVTKAQSVDERRVFPERPMMKSSVAKQHPPVGAAAPTSSVYLETAV